MSRSKIKRSGSHKKKVRGYRQTRNVDAWNRGQLRRTMQEQARRRRLTKLDGDTGEEYILARLALADKEQSEEYRAGLDEALADVPQEAEEQAEAIRGYLQAWVDERRLVPIPCGRGERPSCRVYEGREENRVVVMRQDDPDAGPQ